MMVMGKRAMLAIGAAAVLAAPLAAPLSAQSGEERYGNVGTSLFGDYIVGGKGAGEDASADFVAEFDYKDGKVCYALDLVGIKDFTAAHIHKGKKDENGEPVMELKLSGDGNDVCAPAEVALMKDMEANQAAYYVSVHTKRFPNGAVRGQLGPED